MMTVAGEDILAVGKLQATFAAAGFSRRASNVLAYSGVAATLYELRSWPWEDQGEDAGLARRLLRTPNCGQAVLREVEAFRETGSPKASPYSKPSTVSATLSADESRALDAWREAQPDRPSRPVAIRRLVLAALQVPGSDGRAHLPPVPQACPADQAEDGAKS